MLTINNNKKKGAFLQQMKKLKKERARDTGLGAIESEEMTGIFSSVKRNGNKLRKARMNLRR